MSRITIHDVMKDAPFDTYLDADQWCKYTKVNRSDTQTRLSRYVSDGIMKRRKGLSAKYEYMIPAKQHAIVMTNNRYAIWGKCFNHGKASRSVTEIETSLFYIAMRA